MDSPLTLRLDKNTRERITRIARRRQISVSEAVREAIENWAARHDTHAGYEAAADLVGVVHGGDPKRSTGTGRSLKTLLKRRRNKA
jgi:hypothetical protein